VTGQAGQTSRYSQELQSAPVSARAAGSSRGRDPGRSRLTAPSSGFFRNRDLPVGPEKIKTYFRDLAFQALVGVRPQVDNNRLGIAGQFGRFHNVLAGLVIDHLVSAIRKEVDPVDPGGDETLFGLGLDHQAQVLHVVLLGRE